MLNRRLLRIKIFQALYSFYFSDPKNKDVSLNNLFTSFNKMHELLIRNLSVLIKIAEIIDDRHEANKSKFIQSNDNSLQLKRLSQNTAIENLITNNSYKDYSTKYLVNWDSEHFEMLRKIAKEIEESSYYKEFQYSKSNNDDFKVIKSIYKNHIYLNPVLLSFFEDINMHWGPDQYYVGLILMSFFKKQSFFSDPDFKIPGVFKPVEFEGAETDEDFARILFCKTVDNYTDYDTTISQYLENWEPERIALCDTIILRMACAEILNFSQIPIKVSLNEYIELSKSFSTPKSKIFINGVLDKVISHYNREGEIEKIGRGLQEN